MLLLELIANVGPRKGNRMKVGELVDKMSNYIAVVISQPFKSLIYVSFWFPIGMGAVVIIMYIVI